MSFPCACAFSVTYFSFVKKFDVDEVSDRKRKATDFYQNSSMKNQMSNKTTIQTERLEMLNMFYSRENLCKLCAEGAIRNLMNVLHCSPADLTSQPGHKTWPNNFKKTLV